MNKKVVIFDVDGTLANNQHRQHFVNKSRKPDWESFFSGCDHDTPIEQMIELFKTLKEVEKFKMVLVSGRPERCRSATEKWLHENNIFFDALYMRLDGDRRQDFIIKQEILSSIVSKGDEILFSVDDRNETVKMWRDNNVICLQCAPGDF